MATVPAKSHQPLHNFSLPCWKWGSNKSQINESSHGRRRRPPDSAGESPPPPPDLRRRDGGSCSETANFPLSSCSARRRRAEVLERESGGGGLEREGKASDDVLEVDGSAAKPWNLRPRRAPTKVSTETESLQRSARLLRGFSEGGHGYEKEEEEERKKKKRKFWISLSREEIEEDVYSMTGSKPARRPKKRAKNVQKQLDNVFPGLHFAGVSADSYRVLDAL